MDLNRLLSLLSILSSGTVAKDDPPPFRPELGLRLAIADDRPLFVGADWANKAFLPCMIYYKRVGFTWVSWLSLIDWEYLSCFKSVEKGNWEVEVIEHEVHPMLLSVIVMAILFLCAAKKNLCAFYFHPVLCRDMTAHRIWVISRVRKSHDTTVWQVFLLDGDNEHTGSNVRHATHSLISAYFFSLSPTSSV